MKTIMLVDDKDISNFIMKKHIKACLPETKVVDFINPEMALDAIPAIAPDIIFLDLNMPMTEDGWRFLSEMEHRNLAYRVAILTSSISDMDIEQSKVYRNVIDFISKPMDTEKLIEIYNEL